MTGYINVLLISRCMTDSLYFKGRSVKCKIQKNWCIVTVAPTIEHHGGHSRTPGKTEVRPGARGGVSVSCLASRTRHECPPTQRKCRYGGLALDVDWHYIGSVTATTQQEKGIITLESNPSRGTVLPAPHGKGNKCDKNVKYKRTDALSLWHQQ